MTGSDRWAVLLLVLALLLLLAVGGLEYLQSGERQKVAALAQQESTLKTRTEILKRREAEAQKNLPLVEQMQSELLPAERGNPFAQVLLTTIEAKRATGVELNSYAFASANNISLYPRFTVSFSVSGADAQLFAFVRMLEEGPYRVKIFPVTYNSVGGVGLLTLPPGAEGGGSAGIVIPPGGLASLSLTLTYTAEPRNIE